MKLQHIHHQAKATAKISAKFYAEICTLYDYIEHTCTFMYAVNSFTIFEIGKKAADGALILVLIAVLSVHISKSVGRKAGGCRHYFNDK